MPDDSTADIEAIMAKAAEDHAKFIEESNAIDAAWVSGKLDEWVQNKLKELGGGDDAGSSGTDAPA